MTKEVLIVANWKMHKTQKEIEQWVNDFVVRLGQTDHDGLAGINREADVLRSTTAILAPPLPYLNFLSLVMGRLHLSSILKLGAQNVSQFEEGNYTGEISAKQLKDLECSAVIIGHSECRKYLHETDEEIAKKAMQCLKYGLQPIICISEISQVQKLKGLLKDHLQPTTYNSSSLSLRAEGLQPIIAYEPLFAIGTGQPDTPEDAQKMALEIKKILGQDTRVIYGGSVDSNNAVEFLKQPDIEGLLVGTASLDPGEFSRIIEKSASISHID